MIGTDEGTAIVTVIDILHTAMTAGVTEIAATIEETSATETESDTTMTLTILTPVSTTLAGDIEVGRATETHVNVTHTVLKVAAIDETTFLKKTLASEWLAWALKKDER